MTGKPLTTVAAPCLPLLVSTQFFLTVFYHYCFFH